MKSEASLSRINDYLAGTWDIRDSPEDVKLLAHIEGYSEEKRFTVSPWDLVQISINTGEAVSDIEEFVLNAPDLTLESGASGTKVVRSNGERPSSSQPVAAPSLGGLTVLDAFKWYLFHKIRKLSDDGRKTVLLSDGVFAIKNELFLPDDFIPKQMMEMVEGSKRVDIRDTRRQLQPKGHDNAIFLYAKHDGGELLEPHSFYFNPLVVESAPTGVENLGEKLLKSFTEFQKSRKYEDFLFSRVMRNVIFTVETKKKTEFGKPLFDSSKLSLLGMRGVAEVSGNTGKLKDGLSVADLKRMKAEAEESASNVSESWMASPLE